MKTCILAIARRPLAAAFAATSLIAALPGASALGPAGVRQQNGIEFVTGGIGEQEQQRTRQLGKDMNLQMIFALANGAYLADVDVTIKASAGASGPARR